MELTDDLVAIQGILINVIKITGEFTKINYKGGNEEKILKIIEQIQKHISRKNYVKGGKINSIVDKQVEDIVLFLAINTKYKKPLELADYDHLINIMPQLSKCVLANIVYGLDLCKYYCKVIEKLPINYGIELLEEIVPCLKKSVPNTQLRYAVMFLRAAVIKLSSDKISEKDEYDVFKLTEVTNMILLLLTGLHPGHVKNLKAVQIYQHMGYSLLSLFELLLYCDKENIILKQFIENVLRTACTLLQNVTINVYCSWAEDCSFKIPANSEMTKVRCVLLIIMDECRCTFLELNVVKQQTTAYAVDIIKSLCEVHPNYDLENESHTPADKYKDEFTNYYKKFLSSKTDSTLLRSLYSDFSTENYADCVNRILQFLPRAVSSEWLNVMQEIFSLCGSEKAMELLTDVMILLCKVVETQAPDSNTGKQLIIALKYCLQLYGNALQSIQSDSTEAVEVDITKGVCRLLKHLPEAVKEEVGLSIVNVLTQRTVAQRMAD